MNKVLLSVCLITLCFASGEAQVRRPTSAKTIHTVTDIKQFDFRNYAYRVSEDFNGSNKILVRLRNGKYKARGGAGGSGFIDGKIYKIAFGDLTGDGNDEAFIVIISSNGSSGHWFDGYLFTLKNKQPDLLAYYAGGDRSDGVLNAQFKNNLLEIDRVEQLENDPACCPEHYRTISYQWNGNRLIEIGRSNIKSVSQN